MSLYTIKQEFFAQNEIKKSKFLAYITPFGEFEGLLDRLRAQHPKAAHIVWAYRTLNKYGQIVENQSDDGEPKGSSAPPILDALRGADLVGVGVAVVRYFGGVKLGVGGLVRAYSTSANLAIAASELASYEVRDSAIFFVPFSLNARVEHFLAGLGVAKRADFIADGAVYECEFNARELGDFMAFFRGFGGSAAAILALPIWAKNIKE